MFRAKVGFSKAAGSFVLLISILSTGVVIANECHSTVSASAQHLGHDHFQSSASTSSTILTDICIGVVFFTLLVGGRYLLRIRKSKSYLENFAAVKSLRQFIKPPNIHNALTLPQLGLCRI